MSIFPYDQDMLDSDLRDPGWAVDHGVNVFGYRQGDGSVDIRDAGWVSRLEACVAMVANTTDGLRFDVVSRGLVAKLGISEPEISGRLVAEVLRGALSPLASPLARVLRGGPPESVILGFRPQGFSMRAVARGMGRKGLAIIEFITVDEETAPDLGEALFEDLNRIGGGNSYVYDRKPWLGMNLSVLLGSGDGGLLHVQRGAVRRRVHPDDVHCLKAHRRALYEKPLGAILTAVVRMKRHDGEWRWIQAREQVLTRDARGRVQKIRGLATDVTEHRRLVQAAQGTATVVLKAQQDERRRIAREIHDSLAQHLVVIDLTMSRLEREASLPADAVEDIRKAVCAAHAEVRAFSYFLHPPELERLGLAGAVTAFARGFGARTGLVIDLDMGVLPDLPAIAQLTLFRAAQEALMNVHRHAKACTVGLSLKAADGGVCLEVADDGAGAKPARLKEATSGVGLAGIRGRLVEIGGALELSMPKRGLRLRAWLPVVEKSCSMGSRLHPLHPSGKGGAGLHQE